MSRSKIASLDVGLKRIGVALCFDGVTVLPQNGVIRRNRNQAAKEVRDLIDEWAIDTLIVGLPLGGSSEMEMGRRIRHFVSLLDLPESIEVHYQDEAGSSNEAKEFMKGQIRHKKDGRVDSISAALILKRWLSSEAK